MNRPTSRALAAMALGLTFPAISYAEDDAAQQLRIQELEQRISQLQANRSAQHGQLASTIDAVLRDAEQRSQLLAIGGDMSAGYDNGFFIRSGDNFVFRPGAIFQFRNITNYREDVNQGGGTTDSEFDNGFEVRRMKLELQGTLVNRDLTYFVAWNTNAEGGSMFLEDAFARWMFADQWGVRLGQFKDPLSHEWLTHDGRGLAVERSLLDFLLGGGRVGRTQGVALIYGGMTKDNPLNVELVYHDGANQLNTDFISKKPVSPTPANPIDLPWAHAFDFGTALRIDYKVMGDWVAYRDFTASGNKADLLVVGAGADWSQSGSTDFCAVAVDAQYENSGGLGLFAEFLYDVIDIQGQDSTDFYGAMVQGGYLLNPACEVFARYDFTKSDDGELPFPNGNSEDLFHEITVGFNYFLGTDGSALHRAKFTVDLTYLPNGAPALSGLPFRAFRSAGADILGNNNAEDEWILRGQFQLWI